MSHLAREGVSKCLVRTHSVNVFMANTSAGIRAQSDDAFNTKRMHLPALPPHPFFVGTAQRPT